MKKFLISIKDRPMKDQKSLLEKHFEDWKGKIEQIEDVCVMGVRVT